MGRCSSTAPAGTLNCSTIKNSSGALWSVSYEAGGRVRRLTDLASGLTTYAYTASNKIPPHPGPLRPDHHAGVQRLEQPGGVRWKIVEHPSSRDALARPPAVLGYSFGVARRSIAADQRALGRPLDSPKGKTSTAQGRAAHPGS